MSGNSSKKDTPVKRFPSSSQNPKKEPSITDVWKLLVSMESTVSSHDTHFKNINKNLRSLDNNFCSLRTSIEDLRTELSQLKSDKLALESQINLLRDKIDKLNNSPIIRSNSYDSVIFTEVKDRLSREKNILMFNVPDSKNEDLSVPVKIGVDLLNDLTLPNIKIIHSKRLGNFGSKNRPILLEIDSPTNVLEILKSKSKLRSMERWRQISISEDRTASQRAHMKSLRTELSRKKEVGEDNWSIKYIKGIPSLVQKN